MGTRDESNQSEPYRVALCGPYGVLCITSFWTHSPEEAVFQGIGWACDQKLKKGFFSGPFAQYQVVIYDADGVVVERVPVQ
jgi:hypothetical protein